MSGRRWRWVLAPLALLLGVATADGGNVTQVDLQQVRSLEVDGQMQLDADVTLDLGERVHDALANGLPLNLELYVEIREPREWWWDTPVATLTQRFRLEYHELSRQYVIEDQAKGTQRVVSDERAAIKELGTIRDVMVAPNIRLDPRQRYRARARVELSVATIPLPLRASSYLSADWHMRSDWYTWSLR